MFDWLQAKQFRQHHFTSRNTQTRRVNLHAVTGGIGLAQENAVASAGAQRRQFTGHFLAGPAALINPMVQ